MNILNKGVINIKQKPFFSRWFCKHEFVTGESCSSIGLVCISGEQILTVCKHCGKITSNTFKRY